MTTDERVRLGGIDVPKFCETCGSFMKRQIDGIWKCANKHTYSDAITENIQRNRAKRIETEIEGKSKLLSDLLENSTDEVFLFQLVNPYREKQKTGLTNNPSSFRVYEELHDLERKYPSNKFKYLRGNIFGTVATKPGHIICAKDIVLDVKTDVEKIKLYEKGQEEGHYELKQYTSINDIPKELISKIEYELKKIKLEK